MSAKPRRRAPAASHPYGVIAATGICVAFLLLILLHPELRQERFAQALAGIILALLVAVILFSLFPPKAGVPLAIGTAAGFYLFLFPKVQASLFPVAEILGTVTYQGSQRAVPKVVVRVGNSGQADTTDNVGEFVLRRVAPGVKELRFSVEQFDTIVPVSSSNIYPIVPQIRTFETLPKTIPAASWKQAQRSACPQKHVPPRLYILETAIPVDTIREPELRGKRLEAGVLVHVRLSPQHGVTIVDAQSVGPLPGWEDNPARERPNWKWSFPVETTRSVPLRLEVCYEPAEGRDTVEPPFDVQSWIQGRYRVEP